jgi:hypothetical protein
MRKILTILLLAVSLTSWAKQWYVHPGGSDTDGDGSAAYPWLTYNHAADTITGPAFYGDTIFLDAGTFIISTQISHTVGISVMGTGDATILNFTYASTTDYCIKLYSATLTDGNQSISYLKITGSDYTARRGILVWQRNNVSIHHVTFEKFDYEGANFIFPYSTGEPNPTSFCTGNSFTYNTLLNCAGYHDDNGYGALNINGQDGMQVLFNEFTQNNTAGLNGPPIKAVDGVNKNLVISYNKTFQPLFGNGDHWDFALELWDCRGGCEISYNDLQGSIDLAGKINIRGSSAYSIWAHHNIVQQSSQALSEATRGFIIEAHLNNEDIIIEKNYVRNTCVGIGIGQPNPLESTIYNNIKILTNIFESIGLADSKATSSKGWGIYWSDPADWQTCDSFQVIHNILTAKVGTYSTMWGIQIPAVVSTNTLIQNNITLNFDYASIFGYNNGDADITCDVLSIENNDSYGNGFSNVPRYGSGFTPTNNTTQNNITTDPLFISASDFHLQSTSPCINTALDASAITGGTDFHGASIYGPGYDIGAFEFGINRLVRIRNTIIPTLNYKLLLVDH